MKTENKIAWLLLPGLALAAVCFVANAKPGMGMDDSDKLNQGIALLKQGRVDEAHTMLTNVPADSPVRGQAKAYDALCRYAKGDHKKFLSALESPEVKAATLPDDVREDLDYKQIDSLMYFRKFDEILPKAEQFAQQHADSPRAAAMPEYQMAALLERGIKKLTEAAQLRSRGDDTNAQKRLHEGEDNLGQFLRLAADGKQNNYATLTNRDLPAEVVKAMTALGGEAEALNQVPSAEREAMAFALVRLHNKIDADADANLRRMANFLNDFPDTKYRKRVLCDMANVALEEGWRLTWDSKPRQPEQAAPYLDKAYGLLTGVTVDREAGVDASDVMEAKKGIMHVYYLKKDWASLSNWVAQMLTNVPAGGKDWLAFKLYDAAGLANQNKWPEAAAELDEVLATGFKGNPSHDGLLISAAKWRISAAKWSRDDASAQRVGQMVQSSGCYDSLKRTFLKQCAALLAPTNSISK